MVGSIKTKIILAAVFINLNIAAISQITSIFKKDTVRIYKNEIGIDVANILTFLEKNPQSYLVNYKHYFKNSNAFRSGLNFDISSINENGYFIDTRVGYEFGRQYERWRLFYGSDMSFFYSKSNLQPNSTYRTGIEPLLGVKYYFSKHFSISTEAKMNFYYYVYRNSGSYDPEANTEEFRISLGSVGMVLVNYHF